MFYYYYDWTYILVLIGALICIAASARVKSVFNRYSTVRSHTGMTGREAAEQIAADVQADVVQVIGSKFVLYRKNEKEPKITLPKPAKK